MAKEDGNHPLARDFCRPTAGSSFKVHDKEYTLRGKIGDGAVGLVRKAVIRNSEAKCAIKFLAPDPKYIDVARFDDVAARFLREGERGAKLEHPHLVKILDYCPNGKGEGFCDDCPQNPFILMELLSNKTLESRIKASPSTGVFEITTEKLSTALQLTSALQYLHKKKIVHRDVKPSNIFVIPESPGRQSAVKLGDFGVTKWGDFHASLATGVLTATNHAGLGTQKYMSPEQALRPKDVTVRSDVFSLGITLFELFTNQILPSPYHVFNLMDARAQRGATASRYLSLDININGVDETLPELLLEMIRKGISGRPTIDKVHARLGWLYQDLAGKPWRIG